MAEVFDLYITTNETDLSAELRLRNGAGEQIGYNDIRVKDHPRSLWDGLFDMQRYISLYAGNKQPLGEESPLDEDGLMRELGLFLGRKVLGEDIMLQLGSAGIAQLALRIHFPKTDHETSGLDTDFARIPWEIARLTPDEPLLNKAILFRALIGKDDPAPKPFELGPDEALRVLLVFAEAPGSRPLAMQLERKLLIEMFHRKIYPNRRVEVDVLCHGVTRSRLVEQIQTRGGYHIVHWSGHGNMNLLELHPEGKEKDFISGQELVKIFNDAGGYVPRLFFLSACHSGAFLDLKDWPAFQAAIEGREPESKETKTEQSLESLRAQLDERPGYTGTALALLEANIPTVVAMRYAVGDDYARELAVLFYQRLLADKAPKRPDEALNQARRELLKPKNSQANHYDACDHATPMLYGAADCGLMMHHGNTPLPAIHPRLKIVELKAHSRFVGRSRELAQLGARWLKAGDRCPVAVLRGLGGMGKTALAAETIDLWHENFNWVFAFQFKPRPLRLDEFYLQLHRTLLEHWKEYAAKVKEFPADAIWRKATDDFTGEYRHETLRGNLVEALKDEPILLVLDNFETNLKENPEPGTTNYACMDPGWDDLLITLANALTDPISNSCLLITSRYPLATLVAYPQVEDIQLGSLPPGEAALYIRSHSVLSGMYFNGGEDGRALVNCLLNVSRGHPLLLDRLARLAERDGEALQDALQALEDNGLSQLPDFLDADRSDETERNYLEDALIGSIDMLIERAEPQARRALWILSLANEPANDFIWRNIWEGRDLEEEQLLSVREMIDHYDELKSEAQEWIDNLPDEIRSQIDKLPDAETIAELKQQFDAIALALIRSGLVDVQRQNEEDQNPGFTCHELVRERITAWIEAHPQEIDGITKEQIWEAYGDIYVDSFEAFMQQNQRTVALEVGSSALRYMVRAGAFNKLGDFAGDLMISTKDPSVLRALLPELEQAVASAPLGQTRWNALTYLADALRQGGQPDVSLPYYKTAAYEAQQAEHWNDLIWITHNWANALGDCGQLQAAQEKYRRCTKLMQNMNIPEVIVLGIELEALRIDVMRGHAKKSLPEIESHLQRIREWWEASQRGESVPQSLDVNMLARTFISALNVFLEVCKDLKQWEACLNCVDETIYLKKVIRESEYEIAGEFYNRGSLLIELGKMDEAKKELKYCFGFFERAGDVKLIAGTLSALSVVYSKQGDLDQAISLERRALNILNTLPNLEERAGSHNNLSNRFQELGQTSEAAAHQLAALVYRLLTGHQQNLQNLAMNYVNNLRCAKQAGIDYTLPTVAELISRPDFNALREWLDATPDDLNALQQRVDDFVAQYREAAE